MPAIIRPITALLMSASIILAANGLEGVLLPIRGAIEGFNEIEIGLIGSSYFFGMTVGSLIAPRIIGRVGHIRAFLVFAAVTTISPLIEAMLPAPAPWWLFRGLTGICFAGILNVVESWLTSVASNSNRGQVLSLYAMLNFGSLTAGQQLINLAAPADFRLFSLISILGALAAVPLALTLSAAPTPPRSPRLQLGHLYRVSPAAVAGCFGAGLANGAFWALAPVYARDTGLPPSLIAAFVSLAVLGGALSQWPAGRISDHIDRRQVLAACCSAAAVIGVLLFLSAGGSAGLTLTLGALFGVFALPVYWVSFAHANDLAEPGEAVNVSANLLMLFGVGAVFGPIIAALLKQSLGHGSLFLYTAVIHVLIASAVVYRMTRRAALPPEERVTYDELPINTTSAAFEPAIADAQAGKETERTQVAGE
jgi:MFS family permease